LTDPITLAPGIRISPVHTLRNCLRRIGSQPVCDQLLSCCKADDAQVSVDSEDYSHLRFAANGFTTSGRREDASASVTVWIGGKRGSASANDLDPASLRNAVEQAEQLARISPVDKEYMPTLGRQTYKPVSVKPGMLHTAA